MTTHKLSIIRNFKECGVGYQDRLEVEAVVDAVIQEWADFACVAQTAQEGVHSGDSEVIAEIIESEGLDCTAAECEAALVKECEERWGVTERADILDALEVTDLADQTLAAWWCEYIDPDDNSTPDMNPDEQLEGYLNAVSGLHQTCGGDPGSARPAWQEGFKLACEAWCRENKGEE
jgi:hypothetical protein